MPTFEIRLESFQFPKSLENEHANFRFAVDLRLFNNDNQLITMHTIIPGPETFWECDTRKKEKSNYVRDDQDANKFDMKKVGVWNQLIFYTTNVKSLHSIQFTVYDVDRKDIWDKVENFLGSAFEKLLDFATGAVFKKLPSFLSSATETDPVKESIDDLEASLLKKVIGGSGDKILFIGSTELQNPMSENRNGDPAQTSQDSKVFYVKGVGKMKEYKIGVEVT